MTNKMRLLFFSFLLASQLFGKTAFQPVRLTCEYLENPLGIDMETPRFGWNISSAGRNSLQSAYEIIVSDNEKLIGTGKGNSWQTGKVISDESIQIEYAGKPLRPFTRYYWKVKVYDKNGLGSAWSQLASFETAALKPEDWKAKWIGDGSRQFEKDEDFYQKDPMPLFRKQINIAKKIAAARLYISGLGYSEVYINDQKIGDHLLDPGFTVYRKQALYVTYDITAALKNKNNMLGIMLGNGWYNPLPLRLFGRFNLRDVQQTGRPCVKAQVLIKYSDGTDGTIATDETWETTKGPILRNNVYLGEEYDARQEKKFNEKSKWNNATTTEGPSGELTAQMQPAIKITKIIKPISIKQVGKDTFIVDMGQNFAGVARIKVKGNTGRKISLRYGELIHPNGSLDYMTTVAGAIKEIWHLSGGPGAPKTAWQEDNYTLKGEGTETWNPRFTFHAFRYVEITGWPGTPTVNDIEGLRMNSDLEQQGNFSCSNTMFNQLHDVIQWTFLSNVFSVQSDCPGREKMGYGADIVASAGAYLYNYDMANFYSKTVQDFANDQRPEGGITEIAPSTGIADRGYGDGSGPLGWQLAFGYVQKKLYDYYADKKIITKHYPAFKKQLQFLQSKSVDGLFHWDIGDHEAIDTKADAFTASCFYYHHALLAAEFAGILDKKDDSLQYAALAKSIKQNIIQKYLVPGTGRFDNATQGAQLFALWYDLSPEKEKTFNVLMKEFERHNFHLSTGIFSTMMLFDVLPKIDQNELAYRIADQKDFPGWGYMLANDATTLWESWEKPTSSSYNHPMFGSIDEWFYKWLLGIQPAAPGFKKIIIKPQLGELTWAKGSYRSVYGVIKSEWKKSTDNFELNISVPANTTAEIYLPATEQSAITENDKVISGAGIQFTRFEKGYGVFAVGSGDYRFVAKH
jgi:alpha-L-rhamnosidase